MRRISVIGIALFVALAWAQGAEGNDVQAAFKRLSSLVGEWEATGPDGKKAETTFRLVANGTVLMEQFRFIGEDGTDASEMVTMYHVDGDRLILTHYCVADNQPRMVASWRREEPSRFVFSFLDATNLDSADEGHMHHAELELVDADRMTAEWTFRKDGEVAFREPFEYVRKR
jgi:hypothetical protein